MNGSCIGLPLLIMKEDNGERASATETHRNLNLSLVYSFFCSKWLLCDKGNGGKKRIREVWIRKQSYNKEWLEFRQGTNVIISPFKNAIYILYWDLQSNLRCTIAFWLEELVRTLIFFFSPFMNWLRGLGSCLCQPALSHKTHLAVFFFLCSLHSNGTHSLLM